MNLEQKLSSINELRSKNNVIITNYLTIFLEIIEWQILTSFNMGPLLTSYLCLSIIIWKLLKPHEQFINMLLNSLCL